MKAGRVRDAVRELPVTLEGALEPVAEAVCATLGQPRKARPDQIGVGFDLVVAAGTVIAKSQASGHLKVTVSWQGDGSGHPHAGAGTVGSR